MNGVPEHFQLEGWFGVPHYLLSPNLPLSKSERLFMITLCHFENRFTNGPIAKWFFVTDQHFSRASRLSKKTIIKTRRQLKIKGLLDFKAGRSHSATEYLILMDGYRPKLQRKAFGVKGN